ncbi:alpha/beta-hydrolase [Lactarius psammicola]|nr:alpha/beta-hydrolase [Lactarius psammicola]
MASEQPFKIAVSDDDLALLKRKLDDTRLPDEDGYDWRTHESKLNALPMFTRTIEVDGFGKLSVHYIHQQSAADGAIPLLFVTVVRPGSFIEATKVLPLLTAVSADHPSFHVVAPSLPGYAWSEGVSEKGFHAEHYAELFNKLMISLGYTEYLTLTTASKYGPQHVKASHTNMPICDAPNFRDSPITFLKCLIMSFTSREREAAAATQSFFKSGTGYYTEQSTKPQTLGFSLADSPVGLLAWIYEKLVAWTDAYPWTDDEVLTWVSIYWFSRAGPAASIRIYYEITHADKRARFPKTSVPVGLSFFPKDLVHLPRVLLRAQAKIVFESEHEVGGHFAAYEQPEALVSDLQKMFGRSGPAADIVPGCSGY